MLRRGLVEGTERVVVSTCMQGRSSVAINVPAWMDAERGACLGASAVESASVYSSVAPVGSGVGRRGEHLHAGRAVLVGRSCGEMRGAVGWRRDEHWHARYAVVSTCMRGRGALGVPNMGRSA